MRRTGISLLLLLGAIICVLVVIAVLVGGPPTPEERRHDRPEGPIASSSTDGPGSGPPARSEGEAPASFPPFEGPRKLAVAGTVRAGPDGPPIAGATLRAFKQIPRQLDLELVTETRSGDDGRYVLGPVEERVIVEAGADGRVRERRWARPGEIADFALGTPGTLAGTISYEGDRPCADALVRVHASRGVPAGAIRTDGGGAYRFPDLQPATYSLEVLPPSSPALRVRNVEVKANEETTRDLVVSGGVTLRGRITDAETKEPIAGAEVEISTNLRLKATSDQDGRYEIEGLGQERTRVRFRAKGYLAASPRITPGSDGQDVTHDVALRRGGSIRGLVLGPTGEPVAGARVGLNPWQLQQGSSEGTATTDEQGVFLLEGVSPGQRHVFAVADGLAPGRTSVPSQVQSGQETVGAEIRLTIGGGLAGHVRTEQGESLEGVSVQVWPVGGRGRSVSLGRALPVTTDAEGAFELTHLPAGTYTARAEKEGYAAEMLQNLNVADGGRTEGTDFVLREGSFIAGKVLDGEGNPLAEATVTAFPRRPGRGMVWQRFNAKSGADGTFRLQGLRDGSWRVSASKTGYGNAQAGEVASGTEGLEIRLVEQGTLVVEAVLASSDRPAPSYRLLVYNANPSTRRGWPMRTESVRDASGTHRLKGLGPGQYELEASTSAGLLSERVAVTVVGGADPAPIRLVLESGAALRGVVLSPHGDPVSKARVFATLVGATRTQPLNATTDAEGRYLLRPLRPGTYDLRVTHASWVETSDSVSVSRGVEATADLTLRAGGSLRVVALDDAGSPVAGATVLLRRSNGNRFVGIDYGKVRKDFEAIRRSQPTINWGEFNRRLMATDAAGTNVRQYLPPDDYEVEVRMGGFKSGRADATVRDGRQTTVRVTMVPGEEPTPTKGGPSSPRPMPPVGRWR